MDIFKQTEVKSVLQFCNMSPPVYYNNQASYVSVVVIPSHLPHLNLLFQFYEALTEKALGVAWHVKGRYGLICALLPYVGLQQVTYLNVQFGFKCVTWMILCGPPGCRKFLFEYWKTFHKWTYLTTKIYCQQLFMFFKTYFSHQFWSNILIFKPLLHPTSTFYWIKFQPLFAALFYIK